MRRSLCFALALGLSATASADPPWTAPGWYQVGTTFNGPEIEAGPFEDEDSCQATLPESNGMWSFSCERFEEDPGYPGPDD